MQRLTIALPGTLGFYLRDALEGSAYAMARLHVPRAQACEFFPLLAPFCFSLGGFRCLSLFKLMDYSSHLNL
jgi:hypothetical protein